MPQPFEWNGPSGPDLLSQDLQRRTVLIAVAALIGIGSGLFCLLFAGGQGGVLWLAFSIVALAILFLLVRYFELGIVAFLGVCWIAVGTPTLAQGGSGGGAQHLNISQAGLIVLLLIWAGRRLLEWNRSGTESRLYATPINIPILIYLVIAIWSTVNGVLFPNELVVANSTKQFFQVNVLEVLMRILALGGLLLVGNTLQGRTLKSGAVVLLIPGIVVFFLGLFHLDRLIPMGRFLAFPEQIAMAVLASVALTGTWTRPWVRIVCGALALLMTGWWLIAGAEWVSGWLGPLVALAIISFTSQRKLFWAACALVGLIVLLKFDYFYQNVYVSNFYGNGATHDIARAGHMGAFTNDRSRMWGAAAKYATFFPLGIGIGNFRAYELYFGRVDVWNTTTFTSAHGTYSQVLAETGWLGFFAFGLLIYASGRMLRGYYRALPPDSHARTYVLGAWGGCIGVFCSAFNGDYLFPAYHNGGMGSFGACVYVWLMIGITVAIARHYGIEWSEVAAKQRAERVGPPPRVIAPVYNRGPYAALNAAPASKTTPDAASTNSAADDAKSSG